jgi:hypothetical protein
LKIRIIYSLSILQTPYVFFVTQEKSGNNPVLVVASCIQIFIRDNVVWVIYDDGAEISLAMKQDMHKAYVQITGGKKMPFLFTNLGSFWISKEAREYARAIEPQQPFLAVAYFAPTLDVRLMAEFYGKFHKPAIPYKVFGEEKEALEWLRTF